MLHHETGQKIGQDSRGKKLQSLSFDTRSRAGVRRKGRDPFKRLAENVPISRLADYGLRPPIALFLRCFVLRLSSSCHFYLGG